MIRQLLPLLSLAAVTACSPPKDYCIFAESPQHQASLLREFAVNGIAVEAGTDNALCVSDTLWLEAHRVRSRVHSYRYAVGVMVKSADERERLVALLRREGKEFKVSPPSERGELVILLSGSPEEAEANLSWAEAWE